MNIANIHLTPDKVEQWSIAGIGLLGTVSVGLLITTIVLRKREDNCDEEKRNAVDQMETAAAVIVAVFLLACLTFAIRFYRRDCFDTTVSSAPATFSW